MSLLGHRSLLFRFGFKSVIPRNVRSTSYLGFKEIKFVTLIDEVVHKFLTALFVSECVLYECVPNYAKKLCKFLGLVILQQVHQVSMLI